MNTVKRPMDEWKNVPWRKVERAVYKLQKRIYRASQRRPSRYQCQWPNTPRSRMRGNSHVRFWRRVWAGDSLDLAST